MRNITWTPDLGQTGEIELYNENNAAAAIVLNNHIADTPIVVYQTFEQDTGGFASPVILCKGVLDLSSLTPTSSILSILTSKAASDLAPNRFHTPETGFNHLPKVGTVIQWGDEKFILEADF